MPQIGAKWLALVGAFALLVSGCASEPFPAFSTPPGENDALPADLGGLQIDGLDTDRVRLIGEQDDVRFYIARNGDEVCLIVAAGSDSSSGCAAYAAGTVIGVYSSSYDAQLMYPATSSDGYTAISDYIRLKDDLPRS